MGQLEVAWADFKNLVDSKLLIIDFTEITDRYDLYAGNGSTFHVPIYKTSPANADQTDFEDNYKSKSNIPSGTGEDVLMNALSVRDTSEHVSSVSDNRGFVPKTVIIINGLNQAASVSLFGSRTSDFSTELQLGSAASVAASSNDYATVSDYFPYIRAKVTAAASPSTGSITLYLEKVKT